MSAKKSRVIGNEIFKTIVTMAYEMELAFNVNIMMLNRRQNVIDLLERGQTFRDDEDIRKEIKKYLAISPDNKKHWRFDMEPEGGENGFVLNKEIPISVSGQYRIMLGFIKHTEYEVARDRQFVNIIYIRFRDINGDEWNDSTDNDYQHVVPTHPTVSTVEIIKQKALRLEFVDVRRMYNNMYLRIGAYLRMVHLGGGNCKIWNERIRMMVKDHMSHPLYRKILTRYGADACEELIYD